MYILYYPSLFGCPCCPKHTHVVRWNVNEEEVYPNESVYDSVSYWSEGIFDLDKESISVWIIPGTISPEDD